MRTHLLRTIYPAPAEIEPDTGFAANDRCYDNAPVTTARPASASIVNLRQPSSQRTDEYELGGYAGI